MPNPQLCEVVVLLDRSGSMASIKSDMEGGFNRFADEQKKLPGECVFTLVQFDTGGIDTVYESRPVANVPRLTLEPRGGTPLLDAMGQTITRVGERLARTDEAKRPGKLLFLVITDGEENSSKEFKREQIKKLVEHQTNAYQWVFSYLGANVDAFAEAGSMGFAAASVSNYTPDSTGVKHAYAAVSSSLGSLRSGGAFALTDEQRKKMNNGKSA